MNFGTIAAVFTGIIEATARALSFNGARLILELPQVESWEPIEIGESIAVNGACLTVVASDPHLEFDLSDETVRRTAFAELKVGQRMNLERARKIGDRLGGHIVQGHVDETGKLVSVTKTDQAHVYRFQVSLESARYLIDKGSVTVNGISLTVVDPESAHFNVWVIPHTLSETNLGDLAVGGPVNVEFDVLARYVEKLITVR